MKQKIAIIILFLACLAFPQTFLSQTNSKSQKAAKPSKSKIDKENLQAKKIMEQFIDGVFVQRKVAETFERLTLFEACDKVDSEFGIECIVKELPANLGHNISARLAGQIWRGEAGDIYYILGTIPLTKNNGPFPYSSAEFDAIKTEVFKRNNFSEAFQGKDNRLEIEKRLIEIEKNYDEVETIVFRMIDKSLYKSNLETMIKSINVRKIVEKNRVYFTVGMRGSVFNYILAVRRGRMRIIGLVDGI